MNGRRVSTPHRRAAFLAGGLLALAGVVGPWSVRPAAAASGVDMTLPKGHSIAGHVTGPGGTPIAGIGLEADGDNGSGEGISAADGSFTIQGLRDGTYQVLLLPERRSIYLPHWYGAPTSSRDPDGATNITISGADVAGIDQQLEVGADLSGTVTGVPGSPVTDLLVSARGEIDSNSAFVHADGTYQVVGLFPDTYTLAVITPTNSPYTAGVVQDGAVIEQDFGGTPYDATSGDVTGADFSVSKGVTISGHITGGEGPVQIDALDASGGDGSGETVTDASGDYTVRGLWPAMYSIVFDMPNDPADPFGSGFPYGAYADGALVDQNSGVPVDATGGDITLQSIAIPAGAAMSGTIHRGTALDAGEFLSICDVNFELGCAGTSTEADGTWRVGHFETGDWIIRVGGGYYSTAGFVTDSAAATPVHIDAAGPNVTGIDVTIPHGGSVSGRITGPSGEPVVGAQVFASAGGGVGPGGSGNGTCVTGTDGRYTCGPVLQDMYFVSVNPDSADPEHPGSPYLFGYYDASAPGHYTSDFNQKTLIMVIDPTDHTAPTATSRTPAPGATGVARDATVVVGFSEGVLGVTAKTVVLTDTHNGQTVGATVTYDVTTKTATLHPKALLGTHVKYRVSLTKDIKDWSGNRLVATSWTFTTTADGTPPKVASRVPKANATGVVVYTLISATFSEPVSGVDESSFVVVVKSSGSVIQGDVTYDDASRTATFSAGGDLQPNTSFLITLKATIHDLAGNPLAKTTWSFKTGL